MRLLNGAEIAQFVKERQARAVRNLRQEHQIKPRLAIIRANQDPVIDSYMRLKQGYGDDILVDVDIYAIEQTQAIDRIHQLNEDDSVHGIIVQIPLPDVEQTDEILASVDIYKDVDGLAPGSVFDPATPQAINWLLAGYNVELRGKKISIVGRGRLVGSPLAKMWHNSGLDVSVIDKNTNDMTQILLSSDVIISATGSPGLITANMVSPKAVIVDAGVATDSNGFIGDVAADVRELATVTITPEKGGVGPLTVAALFENVIQAARSRIVKQD